MPFQFEVDGKTGRLSLEGSLTIARVGELKMALLEGCKKVDHVTVCLGQVSEVDLTFFQVLCSAHRLFDAENKTLSITNGTEGEYWQMVERLGFKRMNACALDLKSECLWKGGDG
jgi:anti-anti-sigma regulatory factor